MKKYLWLDFRDFRFRFRCCGKPFGIGDKPSASSKLQTHTGPNENDAHDASKDASDTNNTTDCVLRSASPMDRFWYDLDDGRDESLCCRASSGDFYHDDSFRPNHTLQGLQPQQEPQPQEPQQTIRHITRQTKKSTLSIHHQQQYYQKRLFPQRCRASVAD